MYLSGFQIVNLTSLEVFVSISFRYTHLEDHKQNHVSRFHGYIHPGYHIKDKNHVMNRGKCDLFSPKHPILFLYPAFVKPPILSFLRPLCPIAPFLHPLSSAALQCDSKPPNVIIVIIIFILIISLFG